LTRRHPGDWRGHLRLARLGFNQGDNALAQAGLERAAAAAEAAGVAEAAAGLLNHLRHDLAQRRRESEVTEIAERLRSDEGGEASPAQRLALIGQLIGVDRLDQALAECDELLGAHPAMKDEIEAVVRQGIERSERNFRLRDFLADMLFEQGRYDETLAQVRAMAEQSLLPAQVMADGCRKILRRAPDHLEARRELALAEREGKQWAAITAALDPVLDSPALTAEDRALWVEAAFRVGRLEEAARVGLPLADVLAGETGFMLMLIDILLGAKQFDDAVDVYQKARAAAPENERLLRIERKVINARRAAHMTQLENKAAAGDGLSAEEHLRKAELHYEAGETDEAIIHFQRAADDPRLNKLALAKMAVVLCERGMYDLAEETLDPLVLTRESVQEHPELKEMVYQVARVMEKIRKPDLAAKYYKRIFRVDAAYSDVVQRLERLS
jgi:tetratricopeptide (TPR) repeat protein